MMREQWLARLWEDYCRLAPNVSKIASLLEEEGEVVKNDHIAFRTLDLAPINVAALRQPLEAMGYVETGSYAFAEKRVEAVSFSHPDGPPRIFLSELVTADFEPWIQDLFQNLVSETDPYVASSKTFLAGRLWLPVTHSTYVKLRHVTEYGAWVTAMGIRPNHFTVSVNALHMSFDALVQFVVDSGFIMNAAGGVLKGSSEVGLEQASTMADKQRVAFEDGEFEVPTCYYEFAYRYPSRRPSVTNDGLFDRFIVSSADKIFESTDTT